jgi:hypothetical protein
MQRRAAAIYAAFFIVLAAASYSLIATAQEPTVTIQNPEYELTQGQQFDVDGRTYTVTALDAEMEGGGHGSAATLSRSGEFTWVNESARYTATWENESTVTFQDEEYDVVIPNASDPTEVTLREAINRSAILRGDARARNETVTSGGEEYVVVRRGGNETLVPVDEYFPDPATRTFAEGDTVDYQGNETTLARVSPSEATLAWTGSKTVAVDVSDRGNVTLNDQQYLAVFRDNSTVWLTQDYRSYREQTDDIAAFTTHKNGLWGVSITSGMTAFLLVALAYLPSRY